jgi:hypothetical protein
MKNKKEFQRSLLTFVMRLEQKLGKAVNIEDIRQAKRILDMWSNSCDRIPAKLFEPVEEEKKLGRQY